MSREMADKPGRVSRIDEMTPVTNTTRNKTSISLQFSVLCSSTFLIHIAYFTFYYMQSSLHSEGSLGNTVLAVDYGSQVLFCFFIPPLIIRKIGCKWALTISLVCISLYFVANFHPTFFTLIPCAAVMGIGLAILWASVGTYVSTFAYQYAEITREDSENVVARFFGLFFTALKTAAIIAGGVSYMFLPDSAPESKNGTVPEICGISYCNEPVNDEGFELEQKEKKQINILIAIFLVISVLAILNTVIFLKNTEPLEDNIFRLLFAVFRLMKRKNQMLLILICIGLGVLQSFNAAEYNKAYVTCILGLRYAALAILMFGVGITVGSIISGYVSQLVNRCFVFCCGFSLYFAYLTTLILWTPDLDRKWIFLWLACQYGLAESTYLTQISAAFGVIFPDDKEAAYTSFRLWECVGLLIGFAWSPFMCIDLKIDLMFGFLMLTIIAYLILEYRICRGYKDD